MEGITITMAEVSSTAASINSTNQALFSNLDTTRAKVNDLQSTWQSDAGETIRAKMNSMRQRFDEYQKVVDEYARFLNNTVTNYNATEGQINQSAGQFK
jgi:WXG100 family type VII secretion target